MANEQIGVTFTAQEREVIDRIAADLGRSLSSVVRDCAMYGFATVLEQHEKIMKARQKMNLEGSQNK